MMTEMTDAILSQSGIYSITNTVNGKMYIGSAVSLKNRRGQHTASLKRGNHCNRKLQSAWNRYGQNAFKFSVVEFVENTDNLIGREQVWIDFFSAHGEGYNLCPTAGSSLGRKYSVDARAKMGAANIGSKRSDETRAKMSVSMTGKTHTDETKAKLRAANNGRKPPSRSGTTISAEHKAKIGSAATGRIKSQEEIAKMSAASIGRTHSPETKAKRAATLAANRIAKP